MYHLLLYIYIKIIIIGKFAICFKYSSKIPKFNNYIFCIGDIFTWQYNYYIGKEIYNMYHACTCKC